MDIERIQEQVENECARLCDFSPLVNVMSVVANEIHKQGGSFDNPSARAAWIEVMEWLQTWDFGYNSRLPCRFCDQAFRPRIDELLLTAFLEWHTRRTVKTLIALHRCSNCGGSIAATHSKTYEGDHHTPTPGSIEDDGQWTEELLCEGEV